MTVRRNTAARRGPRTDDCQRPTQQPAASPIDCAQPQCNKDDASQPMHATMHRMHGRRLQRGGRRGRASASAMRAWTSQSQVAALPQFLSSTALLSLSVLRCSSNHPKLPAIQGPRFRHSAQLLVSSRSILACMDWLSALRWLSCLDESPIPHCLATRPSLQCCPSWAPVSTPGALGVACRNGEAKATSDEIFTQRDNTNALCHSLCHSHTPSLLHTGNPRTTRMMACMRCEW